MKKPVRILIVEDKPDDIELAKHEIYKTINDCQFRITETRESFIKALEAFKPDVILAKYKLPRFDGMTALKLALQHTPLTPLILWVDSIREDEAVECLKAGANNYIVKDDPKRLGPAILHALEERKLLRAYKQVEDRSKERERQLDILFSNLPGPVYRCRNDADFSMEFISDQIEQLSGYTAEEFHQHRQHFAKMIHPEDRERVWVEIQAAVGQDLPFELTYRIITATGEEKWVWEKGQGIRGADGRIQTLEGFITNITERRRAEYQYQSIFENSVEGIFQSSPKGRFLKVNPAMARIYGYASPQEMLESVTSIADQIYVDPDKRAEFTSLLHSQNTVEGFEQRNYCKDGSIIWTSTSARVVRDSNGCILYYEGFTQDITQRKEAEEALQNSERRFRGLTRNGLDSISLLSADGTLLWESPTDLRTLNYALDEHVGHNIFFELMHPDDLEWTRQIFAKIVQEPGSRQHGIFRLRHADGTWHWVEAILMNMLHEPGIHAIVANYRDVHEQEQAKEALQNSEKRFRALIENGLDDISLLAADGSLLWESPSTIRNLGYAPDEFVGRNIFQLVHPEDLEWTRKSFAKLLQTPGERQRGMFRLRRSDGTWRWVEAIATNMLHEPYLNAIVVNYRDITEQKQAEIELHQKNTDLELVNSLNELINRGESLEVVVNHLRSELGRIFSGEYTNIYLFNQGEQTIKLHQSSLPRDVVKSIEKVIGRAIPAIEIPIQEDGLFQRVLRSDHGMVIRGPEATQKWIGEFVETAALPALAKAAIRRLIPQIYKILKINSTILVPLISDGQPLGLLNVSGPILFTDQDLRRIENICGQLTTALRRKQVEDALRESQAKYQNLVETSHDLIWSIDAQGKITFLNRASREIYGYEPEELIGQSFFTLMDPGNDHPLDMQGMEQFIGDAKEFSGVESRVRHRDGRQITLSANSVVLRDQDGKLIGITGTSRDITRRKQMEEELKEERNLLRTLIDNIPDRIYAMDKQGRKTLSNIADWKASGGKTMDDVIGKTDSDTYSSELAEEFWKLGKAVLDSGQPVINYEEPGLDADGNRVSILTTKIPLRDNDGNVIGLVGIGRDITERKQTEERLRRSENRYRLVTQATNDIIWEWNPKTHQLSWSENAQHVFGYSANEIGPDETWWDNHIHPDDRYRVLTKLNALIEGKESIWVEEYRFLIKDGSYAYISDRAYIERDPNGAPLRMIGAMANITERKQAETERQALLEIMQGFANTKDLQELLELVHQSIARVIYAENFFVVLHHESTGLFEEIYSVDQYDPPAPPSKLEDSITSYVFRSGKPLLLTQSSFEKLAAQGKVKLVGTDSASWLGVPLKTSGRTIGVMVVQDYENDNRYSEREKDFLASIATQVALVIEHRRAGEALRESEEHYRTIFEGVQDAIFVESLDGKILMVNQRASEMFGYSQAEFLTKTVSDLVPAGYPILTEDDLLLSAEPCETFNKRANGEIFPIEISGRIQLIYGQKVQLMVVRDITERKQSEDAEREQRALAEALRDTAETLNSTLSYGEVLDHILMAAGRVVPHDAASILLIEGESAKVVRSHGFDRHGYDPEIRGIELPLAETHNLHEMFQTREPVIVYDTHSYPGWHRMPATDWLRSSVAAPISIHGEIIGFVCLDAETLRFFKPVHAERLKAFANQAAIAIHNARLLQQAQEEIAERKRQQELLRESEERFSSAFEYASIGMALVAPDGHWLRVNWALSELLGYSEQELMQKTFQDITHPEDLESDLTYLHQLLAQEIHSYQMEKRYFHKLGHVIWALLSVSLVQDQDGKSLYFIAQIQDITERKRVEESLRTERKKAEMYLETAGVLMLALDKDGKVTLINQKGCEILGYSANEIIGKNWKDTFLPEASREEVQDVFQNLVSDDIQSQAYYENSILTKSGEERLIAWHNTLLRDEQGRIISTLSSGEDITERKRAEAEIHRRAKETSALLETSLALTNLGLEATLQTIGNSANTLFLADGCRIFLMEANGETLRCVLALGENITAFSDLRLKLGEGVTGVVALNGVPEIVNQMQDDPRAVQIPGTQEEQEAVMFAPLKERGQTIGVLSIRRLGEKQLFEPSDLELLEAFASLAASAVSKARLFEETQQRLAELRASEERFRQLADNIQEAFWMTDAETERELYMSPAVETIWGRPIQSLMYEPDAFMTSVYSEDRLTVRDAIEREKMGERVQFEYRIVCPDGSLRWIWDRAFPIYDNAGKVKIIAGISADITDRKQIENKLRLENERFLRFVNSNIVGIVIGDATGNIVLANDYYLNILGVTRQDLLDGKVKWNQFTPPEWQSADEKAMCQLRETGICEPYEKEYERPDGSRVPVYIADAILPGSGEQIAAFILDITERKQQEHQLRKLSSAVEHSGSAIVITDTAGNIEYVNRKFTQVTGYSFEEAIGQNPRILKSGFTAAEEYERLWQTISSGREWHGELLNKKKDGTLFWESVTISPILDDRGEITHFVGVKEDVTERKQNELEIRRHIAELEAVYENGLSVGRLLEPGEIGNRVIETFSRYLPWHHVTIRLRNEGSDDLELVAFSLPDVKEEEEKANAEQHYVALINKVGQGLSGWVIQTGMPLRTGNVHTYPQYVDMHEGIQSGLYMPLQVGERVIGVISVESEAPNAFTEQDERLLATLANQTAIAFENARLYEAIQKELLERKRAEEALRVSETHYRALADSITDILFEMDQDLNYTHWNKASEALTGIPAEDAIGKSMEDIFGATEEQVRIKKIYEDVLRNHQPRTFEITLALGGEKHSFEVNAYPSMRGVSVVAKDVTDRRRNEIIMQKRFELMEYSARHSLQELMQRTVDEVSELTGSTIGFFHFMEQDQNNLGMQTWSTNALRLFQVSFQDGTHLPLEKAGLWAEAVRQRRPLIQNDYESLANKKELPQGHVPIVREIVIPIIRNERIMAVMGIGNKAQDYRSHDLEIATRLADYAWDVTERKQMELALEAERNQLVQRVEERTADLSRANSNLARALRVKDEFLANMSHELRTPLNAILGLSESLAEQIAGPLNEKQQKYISTISESGHHLLSLINDILDLAKIEAGQITMDINKVDIHSICQASLRMIKQLAQKKDQEVSLQIDKDLGLMWADERRLKQMIVNLLGNAVKFTPEHGKLGLEVHGDEEANQISITVWDNGIGIKADDLERLFQPFIQLDSGLAREATGTGLGLALVAQMARLHGGSVNAVSEPGKGSRFTIDLPWEPTLALDTASRMRITGKFRAIKLDETNKPTILLVEDTKEVVMMLKDYLELAGYEVFTAQDGVDGLVQARHVKPDLILMDVQMPRMDGFETTRKLRSDPNFRYTPIIALTALAMPHDRERCLEAGMDEYISKPVNLKALIKIIQSCLFDQESHPR